VTTSFGRADVVEERDEWNTRMLSALAEPVSTSASRV
jgi:hypothetical protein